MAGSNNSIPPSGASSRVTSQSSSSDDSNTTETTSFGGRRAKAHSPSESLVTNTTHSGSSESSDSQTSLRRRSISQSSGAPSMLSQSASAQIPSNREMELEGGGKIIFERVNGGDLPTARDGLLKQLNEIEQSGQIDGDSKSKMEKFLTGANAVMDFVMHNKKFQTAVGFIGCAGCIIGGAFCPVLLLGVGPFILVFANGFIDNPMLTGPEGQQPRQTPTPESTKKTGNNGNDDESSRKTKSTDDDDSRKPKTHGGGGADIDSSKTTDEHKRKEMDEERKAEELKQALAEKFREQNETISAFKIKGAPHGPEIQHLLNQLEESKRLTAEERRELIEFQGNREAYIAKQSLDGVDGERDPTEDRRMRETIGARVGSVASRIERAALNPAGSVGDLAPSPEELIMIKNALTREIVDKLFAYGREHGHIPTRKSELRKAGLSTQQLLDKAAEKIGLPISVDSQGKLIHRVLGGYIEDYQRELNQWCGNAGITLPMTDDETE